MTLRRRNPDSAVLAAYLVEAHIGHELLKSRDPEQRASHPIPGIEPIAPVITVELFPISRPGNSMSCIRRLRSSSGACTSSETVRPSTRIEQHKDVCPAALDKAAVDLLAFPFSRCPTGEASSCTRRRRPFPTPPLRARARGDVIQSCVHDTQKRIHAGVSCTTLFWTASPARRKSVDRSRK